MQRGAGRGRGTGVRHTQAGPRWSCRLGYPHALSCLSFLLFRGRGRGGVASSSGDLVCDVSFGRRGWKRAGASCRQIAGFPKPCLCWGLITCGWRGESLALGSPARTAGWVEGDGASGGFCTALRPKRRALVGLQWKLQDFLPPGVFNLAYPWLCRQP